MDFGDAKAELVDGTMLMLAGGSPTQAAIAANSIIALASRLRGSGCRPYGSDMPLRTAQRSVCFPYLTAYCKNPASRENNGKRLLDHATIVFEVLSPSTASNDQVVKLAEYREITSVDMVVLFDPDGERIRTVGPEGEGEWLPPASDLTLPSLAVTPRHAEIFARD
jgi:Uma2 family endonuclease